MAPTSYVPPNKVDKLDNLSEPSAGDIKEIHGIFLSDSEMYSTAGQGKFTSTKIRKPRKEPVTVTMGITHRTGLPAFRARGALSRPAPLAASHVAQEDPDSEMVQVTATTSIVKLIY